MDGLGKMGRLTEAIAAINSEVPLSREYFFHLDVENPTVHQEILDCRKLLRRKPKELTLFNM